MVLHTGGLTRNNLHNSFNPTGVSWIANSIITWLDHVESICSRIFLLHGDGNEDFIKRACIIFSSEPVWYKQGIAMLLVLYHFFMLYPFLLFITWKLYAYSCYPCLSYYSFLIHTFSICHIWIDHAHLPTTAIYSQLLSMAYTLVFHILFISFVNLLNHYLFLPPAHFMSWAFCYGHNTFYDGVALL